MLALASGTHTITANAVHPSGHYTATASTSVTIAGAGLPAGGTISSAYDDDGNVISRTWDSGRSQTLTWDAFDRLIKVVQRDTSNTGYDWSAAYDPLGRRLSTTQQTVTAGAANGAPTVTTSIYDPQMEFLEIGVAVNGAKAWKVYGPDLDGQYGSLQGMGGLEATIVDSGAQTKGVLGDQFGNGVGSITGGTIAWFTTRVGAYGPLPSSPPEILTDITRVAEATAWRSRRVDSTGFIYQGARYYEPTSGRFLSADPAGQAASMSLYDYSNGDPINRVDPTGRIATAINAANQALAFLRAIYGDIDALNAFNAPNSTLAGAPGSGSSTGADGTQNVFGVYPDNSQASIIVVPGAAGYVGRNGPGAYQYNRLLTSDVGGVWIQQVTLTGAVSGPGGASVTSLNGGLNGTTSITYYEAFQSGPGQVAWDQFSTPGWPTGASGTWTVTTQAQFYPHATMADFADLNANGTAGHVLYSGFAPSTYTMPANWWPSAGGAIPGQLTVAVPGKRP